MTGGRLTGTAEPGALWGCYKYAGRGGLTPSMGGLKIFLTIQLAGTFVLRYPKTSVWGIGQYL
jgi:hypothetical protein